MSNTFPWNDNFIAFWKLLNHFSYNLQMENLLSPITSTTTNPKKAALAFTLQTLNIHRHLWISQLISSSKKWCVSTNKENEITHSIVEWSGGEEEWVIWPEKKRTTFKRNGIAVPKARIWWFKMWEKLKPFSTFCFFLLPIILTDTIYLFWNLSNHTGVQYRIELHNKWKCLLFTESNEEIWIHQIFSKIQGQHWLWIYLFNTFRCLP